MKLESPYIRAATSPPHTDTYPAGTHQSLMVSFDFKPGLVPPLCENGATTRSGGPLQALRCCCSTLEEHSAITERTNKKAREEQLAECITTFFNAARHKGGIKRPFLPHLQPHS